MADTVPMAPVAAAPVGRPVRAPKTAELIAADLRSQIVNKVLVSGAMLPPEAQLMGQYGVSRPTLREAFRILETEALIAVRRGSRGGAQVTLPDSSVASGHVGLLLQLRGTTIGDVYEARRVIEPYCARLLATRRTTNDVADLRAAVEALAEADEAGNGIDGQRWGSLTSAFHALVVERCGNQTLAVQSEMLDAIVTRHLAQVVSVGRQQEVPGASAARCGRSPSWSTSSKRVMPTVPRLIGGCISRSSANCSSAVDPTRR